MTPTDKKPTRTPLGEPGQFKNLYLTTAQVGYLNRLAARRGTSASEALRSILDLAMKYKQA